MEFPVDFLSLGRGFVKNSLFFAIGNLSQNLDSVWGQIGQPVEILKNGP